MFCYSSGQAWEDVHFGWSPEHDAIMTNLMEFRMAEVRGQLLEQETRIGFNIANEEIWLGMLLIEGMIGEDDEARNQYYQRADHTLSQLRSTQLERWEQELIRAEIYTYRSILLVQENRKLLAARDMFLAYRSYRLAFESDSNNLRSLIGWGAMQIVLGSVPSSYKSYAEFIGLKGDVSYGKQLLKRAIAKVDNGGQSYSVYLRAQTEVVRNYLAVVDQDVSLFISRDPEQLSKYPLYTFLEVEKLLYEKQIPQALEILKTRSRNEEQLEFHYLNYLEGRFKVLLRESNSEETLLRYVDEFEGEDYKKSALLYAYYNAVLNGDLIKQNQYRELVLEVGATQVGEDVYACEEMKFNIDRLIVKARILNELGDFEELEGVLNTADITKLDERLEKEWYYLKGCAALGRDDLDLARFCFRKVAESEFSKASFIIPASCFKLGEIALTNQNLSGAAYWFDQCLTYSGYPFESDYQRAAISKTAEVHNQLIK